MSGPRAIVLGVEHPRALAVIRSLGRAGVPVVAVDHFASAAGFRSRYVKESHRVSAEPNQAVRSLEGLAEHGGGVLIPTNDEYLVMAVRNYERLARHFVLALPPPEVLEGLMDLGTCYAIGRRTGVRTPPLFKPRDQGELEAVLSELNLEDRYYLLKTSPVSMIPADARTGRLTKPAGLDPGTIRENCREIFSRAGEFPYIVQVVPGEAESCIGVSMVVNRQHRPVGSYCVRRRILHTYTRNAALIHPYELGANVYCESFHDEQAVQVSQRFVKEAGFYGLITLEFRRDSTDGELTFIKADPRPVRTTALSTTLGMDAPRALYQLFTNGPIEARSTYPDGVGWVWIAAYLDSLWRNRSNRSVRSELSRLLRRVGRIRSFAYLDAWDPLPAVLNLGWFAKQWLKQAIPRRAR
jgi:predicted ATP-grasp superfamily ATP-dependent carboligase